MWENGMQSVVIGCMPFFCVVVNFFCGMAGGESE